MPVIATVCWAGILAAGVFSSQTTDTALAADSAPQNTFGFLEESPPSASRQEPHELARIDLGRIEKAESKESAGATAFPPPSLPRVAVTSSKDGQLSLTERPAFRGRLGYKYAGITDKHNVVFYTLEPELQEMAEKLVASAQANHVAIAAMNPRTGAVLALAGRSSTHTDIEYHASFPAASLFKVVTASAAVEEAGLASDSLIAFRGGNYTLNQSNFMPDARRDRRLMSIGEAMGKSCNPVFGHIGVRYLNGPLLNKYARRFGFNQNLGFEAPLDRSQAVIPLDSLYELSRTAAGFGDVTISPVHAAAMASGIANGGLLPRPFIIEKITSTEGDVLEQAEPTALQRIVNTSTSQTVVEMMHNTTTHGTSRREFMRGSRPALGGIQVAAKTGTLSGTNPRGLNNWFIAAAPISNPQIAIAVITVDARRSSKASALGRRMFEKYFNVASPEPEPRVVRSSRPAKSKKGHYAHRVKAAKKAKPAARSSKSKKK
jgi:membrane peptidoglycan carboxypeptidase